MTNIRTKPLLNRAIALSVCSASLVLFSACSGWPTHGQGGQAEYDLYAMHSVDVGKPLGIEHALRFDYSHLKNQLDILVLNGANYCFPASVKLAKLKQNRIARELSGNLFDDASVDIVSQRIALNTLENQLAQVLSTQQCIAPNTAPHTGLKKQIWTLLNSDNQFAVDSDALNPKYKTNLALAAELLKPLNTLTLLIVGHTDSQGATLPNLALSQRRAQTVSDYLVSLGLPTARITLVGVANAQPGYNEITPADQLANRRVVIHLEEH